MKNRLFLILYASLIFATSPEATEARTLKRVGWVEQIAISEVGTIVKAKMDTGAKTSSIDAEIIDIRKTGEHIRGVTTGDSVLFSIALDNGGKKTFEREIKRYVRIKKKGGGYVRRPVIKMKFCVAGRRIEEEVNLANREGFLYPVLVGRNMMQHADLVIDASKTFVTRPTCDE